MWGIAALVLYPIGGLVESSKHPYRCILYKEVDLHTVQLIPVPSSLQVPQVPECTP